MFNNLMPSSFIASTTALMVDLFNGLSPVITLLIALLGVSIILGVILNR